MSEHSGPAASYRASAVAAAHLAQQRVLLLAGVALSLFVPVADVVDADGGGESVTVTTHLLGAVVNWLAIDPEEVATGGSTLAESLGRGLGLAALVIVLVGLGLTVVTTVRSAEDWAERSVRVVGGIAIAALVVGVVGFWVGNQLLGSDEYAVSTAWGLVLPLVVTALLVRLRRDHVDLA